MFKILSPFSFCLFFNLSINEIEERLSRRTRSGGKLYREQNDYEKKEVTFDAEIFGDEE